MINNFLDDIRLSLDGSSAKDLILSTKTNDRFCAALKKGTESRTVLHSMICRYALYILGKCTEKELFPFSILSEPGSLAPKSYQRPLENELCIQDGNAGPGFVVNLPCSKGPKETAAVVDLIFREAFDGTPDESKAKAESHLRVVVGANRPRSLNKEQNRRFKKWVQSTDLPLGAKLFGFFWIPRWVDAHQRAVSVKKVREQWLALKELDAPLAEKLLKSLEAPGDAIRKRVPYGSIRNRIKDHTFTKGSVEELRLISAVRPLYLALLDPSVTALNGLYSRYQKMITGSRIPKHILTTGYKLSDDEVDALRFGVALEQKIRQAVARRWFFYPVEPNSIFLVEPEEETIPQSFLDKQKAESLEGRRFAKNIIAARELTVKNTRFSCRGAVTIVARERFFTQSITEVGAVTTKNRGQKKVQKALRGISQNHFNSYKWAKSFLPWLSVPYNVALIPSIQKALNAFEPFSLAESLYQGPYNQSAYEQVLRLFPTYYEWMEWSLEHFEEVWEFDETTSEALGKALYKELKDQKKLRGDDSRTLFQNLAKIRLGILEECAEELLEAGLEQEEILNILYSGLESATVIYNMMIDL